MIGTANYSGEFDVLIVDPNGETNEVIATVLRRHGLQTLAAESGADGLAKLKQGKPRVTILDLGGQQDQEHWNHEISRVSRELEGNLIVLGDDRATTDADGRVQFIVKPYRYGPLIRTIESLVGKKDSDSGNSIRKAA